jgi:hypothetical protein
VDTYRNSPSGALNGAATRLLEYTLAAGVFLGSFALWVVAPFGSLWIASKFAKDATTMVIYALFITPVAMTSFAFALGAVYRAYLRVSGAEATRDRTAWLGSLSGDRRLKRGRRPILDVSLTFSAITAMLLLVVWFVLWAENPSPAGFVP